MDDSVTADLETRGIDIVNRWIEEVEAQDIDGTAIIRAARIAIRNSAE